MIDEVRVYARALSAREIREDMLKPVRPAAGLVAGYGFDGGSAADDSGGGHPGTIMGATQVRGRFGDALRFDGAAVVKVPAAPALNLTRAMTLSGWVRPSEPQDGWRTVVNGGRV